MSTAEVACSYATMILHDDGIPITAKKIATLLKSANVKVDSLWPRLFAKLAEKRNVIGGVIMNPVDWELVQHYCNHQHPVRTSFNLDRSQPDNPTSPKTSSSSSSLLRLGSSHSTADEPRHQLPSQTQNNEEIILIVVSPSGVARDGGAALEKREGLGSTPELGFDKVNPSLFSFT
ncbi:hypothetical protein ACLB2K_041548 [Fragaria x ananassa]